MTRSLPWAKKQEREESASRKTCPVIRQSSIICNNATAKTRSSDKCVKELHYSSAINSITPSQKVGFEERHNAHIPSSHSLMQDGFDADDKWRMVEDELLETAKTLTQSLRQAEYKRLMKNMMDERNSGAYKISRPTTITSQSIGKAEGLNVRGQKNVAKRKFAYQNDANDSDDEDETPWMNDDCLADLMTSHETKETELMDLPHAGSPDDPSVISRHKNFSSSAEIIPGVRNIVQDPDSDEDDDLDCSPSLYPVHHILKKSINNSHAHFDRTTGREPTLETKAMTTVASSGYPYQEKMSNSTTDVPQNRLNTLAGLDNDYANMKHFLSKDERTHNKNRKILSIKNSTHKLEEEKYNTKSISLCEIPTFLV